MDILDLEDAGEVDSENELESEDEDSTVQSEYGISVHQLEANYQMLGSVAPQEKSSILLPELRVKHPQVQECFSCQAWNMIDFD